MWLLMSRKRLFLPFFPLFLIFLWILVLGVNCPSDRLWSSSVGLNNPLWIYSSNYMLICYQKAKMPIFSILAFLPQIGKNKDLNRFKRSWFKFYELKTKIYALWGDLNWFFWDFFSLFFFKFEFFLCFYRQVDKSSAVFRREIV